MPPLIARTLQELADAVNVMELSLVAAGIVELGDNRHLFRMAGAFAADVLLASNPGQVAALIREHPTRARAFLAILSQVREELEGAGVEISAVPAGPFRLYGLAADAVGEAIHAYRHKRPLLPLLPSARPRTSVGER